MAVPARKTSKSKSRKRNKSNSKVKLINYNICKNMTYSLKIRETFRPYCCNCRFKNIYKTYK